MYFSSDIHRAITAGVVLAIETAAAGGPVNGDVIAGVVTMAKHQALAFGVPWLDLVGDVRAMLGNDACYLLGGVSSEIKTVRAKMSLNQPLKF